MAPLFLFVGLITSLALRCYPPTTLNVRIARYDTTLPHGAVDSDGPILIPGGQMIIYSSWSSHHSTRIYGSDAWAFRPERWEDLPADPPGYVPFNAGPRACPGRKFHSSVRLVFDLNAHERNRRLRICRSELLYDSYPAAF